MRCRSLAALALAAVIPAAPPAAADGPSITWLEDWGSTLKQARENDQLIMVDFYTSWCTFCKTLERESFTDPRIVALLADFACAKLDAEVQKAAATRYSPEGYPTLLFATPDGEEIIRLSGYRPREQVYRVVKSVAEVGPEIAGYLARLGENRKDLEARSELGRIYLELGVADKAMEHLNRALKLARKSGGSGAGGESAEARVLFLMSRCYLAEEDHAKASKTLQQLIDGYPSSPASEEYYRELEQVYLDWGKGDLARSTAEKRLRLYPDGG